MSFDPREHPHRRYNPLLQEWILVSPHRAKRPWLGQTETPSSTGLPEFDPDCYLCPGNVRANGERNPQYPSVFVFDNDFAAVLPDTPEGEVESPLFQFRAERGICRVVCFSPNHQLTLAHMSTEALRNVVEVWAEQYEELGRLDFIRHVQIFENKGAMMGCSNPHPHGQIWAQESVPTLAAREIEAQAAYHGRHGSSLLVDYVAAEIARGERVVHESPHFVAVIPYWAAWPYEILLMPKQAHASLASLTGEERDDLARMLGRVTATYDRLFASSFPYSMGIHQAPTKGDIPPGFGMHIHFYPPLLRSAEVRKYMVGYEMLGEPQRDITPEEAADRLRGHGGSGGGA